MPTALSSQKPKTNPPEVSLSREERFWQLYLAAFQGLHAQFELQMSDGTCYYNGGKAALERSKHLALIAWNSARYALQLFDEEETIQTFNSKVDHAK
jgi:hypothetical protein